MGLFWKKKMTEKEAAYIFVNEVMKSVQQTLPGISKDLEGISGQSIPDEQGALFELLLAVVAIQTKALPNFLTVDQAKRIREYILEFVSPPNLGLYPRDMIQEYWHAWDQSLAQGKDQYGETMSLLCAKLGYSGDNNIIRLMVLDRYISYLCCFKGLFEDYRLVP